MARGGPKTDEQRVEFIPLFRPFLGKVPIPAPGICDEPCSVYRINVEWRGLFISAMRVLTQTDIWDSTDPDEIQAAIDQIQELIGMSPCRCSAGGGGSFTRNTLDVLIAIENQRIFDLGGLTLLAPDRPDTTFSEDSGDTGDEIARRDVALCWACHDFVASIAEKGLLQGADIQPGIAFASLAISFFFGPLVGNSFGAVTQAIILGVSEFMNGDDDISQVACCLYVTLRDQAVDQTNFMAGLDVCPDVSGTGAGFLLSLVRFALDEDDSWFSFVKSLGSYLPVTDALSVCPCDLVALCASDFTIDDGDWTAVAGFALYDPLVGWGPSTSGGMNERVFIGVDFADDTTMKQVRVTCSNFDDEDWNWAISARDEFDVEIDGENVDLPEGTTVHTFNLTGVTAMRRLNIRILAIEGLEDSIKCRILLVEVLDGDCTLPDQPV